MSALVAPGTPIAVVAPSGAYDPVRLESGLAIARAHGHELRLLSGSLEPFRYLAAPDDRRLAQLTLALTSPEYGAVWFVRGGYGVTRILDRIDFSALPPRPAIGFSDVVPLLDALQRRVGSPVIHGPVLHSLPITDAASVYHLFALLAGEPIAPLAGQTWVPGTAQGPLRGGNLCMLAATCGTAFQLDARGAILVLEEVGEHPYRIDRMLQQLASAGVFDGVAGVALGDFVGCHVREGATWTLRDILLDHLAPLGVPVVGALPISHGDRNCAFPIGAMATLGDGGLAWGSGDRST